MRKALLVAPGLAVVAAVAAVFLPVQQSVVSQSGPGPLQTLELEYAHRSLLRTEGASVLVAAGLPVLVALMPLAFGAGRHGRRAEIVSAVLLGGFVVVAGSRSGSSTYRQRWRPSWSLDEGRFPAPSDRFPEHRYSQAVRDRLNRSGERSGAESRSRP